MNGISSSLATKLNVLAIAPILVTVMILSVIVVLDQNKEITGEMLDDGLTMARVLASNAEYGLYTEDEVVIEELLQTLRADPDVEFAALLDSDRRVLGIQAFHETEAGGAPAAPRLLSGPRLAEGREEADMLDTGRVIEILVPVVGGLTITPVPDISRRAGDRAPGEVLGYALIGISKEGITRRAQVLLLKVMVATFLVVVAGLLVTIPITRRIVRPLLTLHAAVDRISEDEPFQSVEVQSSDEIGGLSRAFNRMLLSLKDYRARVEERTSDLKAVRDELEKQNEELKELDRMKDSFVNAVSHEMKTPVAKHAMQLEILRPAVAALAPAGGGMDAISVMEEGIRRQQRTIQNLLDLSRLEAGKVEYRSGTIVLDEFLKRVVNDFHYEIDAHHVNIEIRDSGITVDGDEHMLWHAFSNIIGNSIKFSRKEVSPRIIVSAREEGGRVRIEVQDNGIGLGEKEVAHVFSRFYQASHSIEGSGVGLSISRMIIEGHRGRIWMESAGPGKGALTVVLLPLPAEGVPG